MICLRRCLSCIFVSDSVRSSFNWRLTAGVTSTPRQLADASTSTANIKPKPEFSPMNRGMTFGPTPPLAKQSSPRRLVVRDAFAAGLWKTQCRQNLFQVCPQALHRFGILLLIHRHNPLGLLQTRLVALRRERLLQKLLIIHLDSQLQTAFFTATLLAIDKNCSRREAVGEPALLLLRYAISATRTREEDPVIDV